MTNAHHHQDMAQALKRPDFTDYVLSSIVITLTVAAWLGLFFIASKAFPNIADTVLTAQEQAQAHREGW